MPLKHDPPSSEKSYDDSPGDKLRASQDRVSPGKTDSMGTVKETAGAAKTQYDEPNHESAPEVMRRATAHLKYHSHGGIHKVV